MDINKDIASKLLRNKILSVRMVLTCKEYLESEFESYMSDLQLYEFLLKQLAEDE